MLSAACQIAGALQGTPAAGQVSNADLIALAAAKAVAVCGGPSIPVLVGRQDATAADPPGRMVSEKAGVEALKLNFADKGLGVKEMVVLSGAHTLGGYMQSAQQRQKRQWGPDQPQQHLCTQHCSASSGYVSTSAAGSVGS
jgi:catalase (peroxidase I)